MALFSQYTTGMGRVKGDLFMAYSKEDILRLVEEEDVQFIRM